MNPNPTQAEIQEFNRKWDERVNAQFAVPEPTPEQVEYAKKLAEPKEQISWDQARINFLNNLFSRLHVEKSEIQKIIASEPDYQEACRALTAIAHKIPYGPLEGKGGIYLFSEPGVGKTTLMGTAFAISVIQYVQFKNPTVISWQTMRKDITDKLQGINNDLTYNFSGNLFLDELTEKLNQVSHYGDYKYSLNEVIQNRHDAWKSRSFWTIIGSNLHPDILKQNLDPRSVSRFDEQYLVIKLLGESKRKKINH